MAVIHYHLRPGQGFSGNFDLAASDRVLDLSETPWGRATVKGDLTLPLPYGDREFDFVHCRLTLQKVSDPAAACRELMRVARRGFIEVPAYWSEYLVGQPSHLWLVNLENDVLVFRRKPWVQQDEADTPFGDQLQRYLGHDEEFIGLWQTHRNLRSIQLLWEESFEFRVVEGPVHADLLGSDPTVLRITLPPDRVYDVPLSNAFGPNYPRLFDGPMVQMLGIQPSDRVIDVGGGNNPLSRANVVTDLCFDDNHHRSGNALVRYDSKEYVECQVEALPFPDGSFDFAFCSHTLEHVADPAAACEELMRIARRGYLEVPHLWSELMLGYPAHRWLIELVDGVLTFRRRTFLQHPFKQILRGDAFTDAEFHRRYEFAFRNLQAVQLAWEGRFEYRVIDEPNGFDYDDPRQAGMGHMVFALNDKVRRVPLAYVKADLEQAVRLIPDSARAWRELALCQEADGEPVKAAASREQARLLEARSLIDRDRFHPSAEPMEIEGAEGLLYGLVLEAPLQAGGLAWVQRFLAEFKAPDPVSLVLGVPCVGDWEQLVAQVARHIEDLEQENGPNLVLQVFDEGDRPRFLRSLKAYLLDSDNEHAERLCLEAMACGLPVIGESTPRVDRWLLAGRTGLPAADGLRHALERADDLAGLGRNARAQLEQAFDITPQVGTGLA